MRIYIGHDPAEQEAYEVACKSLARVSKIRPEPLSSERLAATGLLNRPVDLRGQRYDLVSNAPASTDFAVSRFLTPLLCQQGWALFVDCDVVFLGDPAELTRIADPGKAVHVVKHSHRGTGWKMVNQVQTDYPRKNWSSVMLFNCDHPANRRLSLRDVNERPGRDLHALYWLHDDEIGELPVEWNWLVNVQARPEGPGIAHFTLGGPWLEGWQPAEHDDIWLGARDG